MKVLSVSDKTYDFIYSPAVKERFKDADFCISCGDLPYYYVEYLLNALNVELYFVRGNHANKIEYSASGNLKAPRGAIDLHRQVINHKGILLAGIEGSMRYNSGLFQYTEGEMWQHVFSMVPNFLINKASKGRFLDVFITHAPPAGIHDKSDRAHRGSRAFLWLLKVFKPKYHFHGHIHVYTKTQPTLTQYAQTSVINSYGYRETILDLTP